MYDLIVMRTPCLGRSPSDMAEGDLRKDVMERSRIPEDMDGQDIRSSLFGKTVAVTGASGAIGRRLVPALVEAGAKIVLFGRDRSRLQEQYPGHPAYANEEWDAIACSENLDAVIDLAVLNNRAQSSIEEFRKVNAERFNDLLASADRCRIPLVIGISSLHALDPGNSSGYAVSKREMLELHQHTGGARCRIVVLPKVVMSDGQGLTGLAWKLAATLKPAAFQPQVIEAILEAVARGERGGDQLSVPSMGHAGTYTFLSRCIDYGLSLGVLIGAGWLMLILAIVVRLDSPGPAIFAQRRVGRNERPFTLYKFRTMAVGTREAGTHEITASSVTRVGALLRRLKLDELPQVFNILTGDLSFVGPRPCLPVQTQLVEERRRHGIFALRPGITGLAQVYGIDMSDPQRLVQWEVRYLRLQGIALDLRLVFETFIGRGSGDRTSA